MAEMNAFGRRLAPRHTHHVPAEPQADAPQLYYAPQPTGEVVMAPPPSSRGKKRARAMAAAPTASTAGERKRMSGAQLRVFFLLCVGAYFSIIYFADEIVSFAQWMSDEPPGHAWSAAVAAVTRPPSSAPPAVTVVHARPVVTRKEEEQAPEAATEAPNSPPSTAPPDEMERGKQMNADGGDAAETSEKTPTTVEEATKKGNLRGVDTKVEGERTDTDSPSTITPARTTEVNNLTDSITNDAVEASEPTTEPRRQEDAEPADAVTSAPSTVVEKASADEALVKAAVEGVTAKANDAQDDAPLESTDEKEEQLRAIENKEETDEGATSQLPASAEIPSLAVPDQPSHEVAGQAQDGAVNPDDAAPV